MLRKLSSKFKRKSTSTQQSGDAIKAATAVTIIEEVDTASPALSTPKSRKAVWKEEQQKAAAESLRKRLKAELRPDLSTDGLHQIQLNTVPDAHHEGSESKENELSTTKVSDMPSLGIRRVSTKWDSANPFRPLRSSGTKTEDDFEATGHRQFRDSQDGSAEKDDPSKLDVDSFKYIALASVPKSCRGRRGSVSASWLQANSHSHPYRHQQSLHKFREIMSASAPLIRTGAQVGNILGAKNSSNGSSSSSSSNDASTPVVVARAECELAHPRPSRSSETKMMKVLVAEKSAEQVAEKVAERAAKSEGVRRQRGHQISQESESMASLASYHTARQETSGD